MGAMAEPLTPPDPAAGADGSTGGGDGLWAPHRRALTVGVVLTITLVASEALAVTTILPAVEKDLGDIYLYGWVTSAFVLSSLIGIVVAGEQVDRWGPARPYAFGLTLFVTGLVVAGAAPSMLVLVAARVLQGLGAGVIPPVAYTAIGRSLPPTLRPRMFAVLSTAWVVPGLVGPGLSALVAEAVGWRWVFAGLVPLVMIAAGLALPSLRAVPPPDALADNRAERTPTRLPLALRLAAGTGLALSALTARSLVSIPIGVVGAVLAVTALRRLLPAGTVRARAGLPAAVLCRGLLTFAFFGADAYVPLAVTGVRHHSTTVAGIAVTTATLSWTAASWVQAHLASRWSGRRLVGIGFVLLAAGISAVGATLVTTVPFAVIFGGWAAAGFGIGLSYAPISLIVLHEAPEGSEGAATSAMQLSDNLGFALGAGLGGVAVAAADAWSRPLAQGIGVAFAMTVAVALVGRWASRRLPGEPLTA